MTKVFIDGSAGTTGLRIHERLSKREDIELIILPDEIRKDESAVKEALFGADIAFLCLPDAAAVQAVELARGSNVKIIDTSTAHRTDDSWVYGFPELTGMKDKIAASSRIANPGCHASGFIALVAPLVEAGVIAKDAQLTCFSLTGYSGGGKKMIADYENPENRKKLESPGMYGLSQSHKHLPEMKKICALEKAPVFCPIVAPYYSGMEVTVSLFADSIGCNAGNIAEIYSAYYNDKGGLVRFAGCGEESFLYADVLSGRDDMLVSVAGNSERILLVSRFDNLGKGASGAAIQNMNILMGLDGRTGLKGEWK